jgi:hypothetical protein
MPILQTYLTPIIPGGFVNMFTRDAQDMSRFGSVIAVSGNEQVMAVTSLESYGNIHIYDRINEEWQFLHTINNHDKVNSKRGTFASTISLSFNGHVLIIGDPQYGTQTRGFVYIYERVSNTYGSRERVPPYPHSPPQGDRFGSSVLADKNLNNRWFVGRTAGNVDIYRGTPSAPYLERTVPLNLAVGTRGIIDTMAQTSTLLIAASPNLNSYQGAIHLIQLSGNNLVTTKNIGAITPTTNGYFGRHIAVSSNIVLINNGLRVVVCNGNAVPQSEVTLDSAVTAISLNSTGTKAVIATTYGGAKVYDVRASAPFLTEVVALPYPTGHVNHDAVYITQDGTEQLASSVDFIFEGRRGVISVYKN